MSDNHINSIESKSIEDDRTRARASHRKEGGSDPAVRAPTQRSTKEQRVTFDLVLRELRAHNFAVLATVDEDGAPDSAGVNYGVSAPGHDLALYVMTRRHLKKARNIARNPRVALVIPLPRHLLQFIPPATIQLHGRAEILDWTDEEGTTDPRGLREVPSPGGDTGLLPQDHPRPAHSNVRGRVQRLGSLATDGVGRGDGPHPG